MADLSWAILFFLIVTGGGFSVDYLVRKSQIMREIYEQEENERHMRAKLNARHLMANLKDEDKAWLIDYGAAWFPQEPDPLVDRLYDSMGDKGRAHVDRCYRLAELHVRAGLVEERNKWVKAQEYTRLSDAELDSQITMAQHHVPWNDWGGDELIR